MKHSSINQETFEFNLGHAPRLYCQKSKNSSSKLCNECEYCVLNVAVLRLKTWIKRIGHNTLKQFMLKLIQNIDGVDLLKYILSILSSIRGKDFTYSRIRSAPSIRVDSAAVATNRALSLSYINSEMNFFLDWFSQSNYWTKCNFLLSIFKDCDMQLLQIINKQAATLLLLEEKKQQEQDCYENESLVSTCYSLDSEDRVVLSRSAIGRRHFVASSTEQSCFSSTRGRPGSSHSNRRPHSAATTVAKRSHSPSLFEDTEIGSSLFQTVASDDEFDDLDPALLLSPTSVAAHSGVAKHKDFVKDLPAFLAKPILGMLDKDSLMEASRVSQHWMAMVDEVKQESDSNELLKKDIMLFTGATSNKMNPSYARDVDVLVPCVESNLDSGSFIRKPSLDESPMEKAYRGFKTRKIIMEERNICSGAYNVLMLSNSRDGSRVIHTDGNGLVAVGAKDRKVRLLQSSDGTLVPPVISGHAGSVRAVSIDRTQKLVLSGSYDTSIRCWSLESGKCMKIFHGHSDTVLCLFSFGRKLVSGAKDKTCKVWRLESSKPLHSFKHPRAVSAVVMGEDASHSEVVVSGCCSGGIYVWSLASNELIKHLSGHQLQVTGLQVDRWHIASSSLDGFACVWSAVGQHTKCITTLRHPRAVNCVAMAYLRVVTGCEDGKIRIFNLRTAVCLRIVRGTSSNDPITTLLLSDNSLTINTPEKLLVMNFEQAKFNYEMESDSIPGQYDGLQPEVNLRILPYSYSRAQRLRLADCSARTLVSKEMDADLARRPRCRSASAKSQRTQSAKTQRSAESAPAAVAAPPPPEPEAVPVAPPQVSRRKSWAHSGEFKLQKNLSLDKVKLLMRDEIRNPYLHQDQLQQFKMAAQDGGDGVSRRASYLKCASLNTPLDTGEGVVTPPRKPIVESVDSINKNPSFDTTSRVDITMATVAEEAPQPEVDCPETKFTKKKVRPHTAKDRSKVKPSRSGKARPLSAPVAGKQQESDDNTPSLVPMKMYAPDMLERLKRSLAQKAKAATPPETLRQPLLESDLVLKTFSAEHRF